MPKHKHSFDFITFHLISVFRSNLKMNSSIFTDDEGSAEESENSSSEIVRYETKLKCTLNRTIQQYYIEFVLSFCIINCEKQCLKFVTVYLPSLWRIKLFSNEETDCLVKCWNTATVMVMFCFLQLQEAI